MLNNEQRATIETFSKELDELRDKLKEQIVKRDKLIIHLSNDKGLTNAEIARLFNMKPQNVFIVLKKA